MTTPLRTFRSTLLCSTLVALAPAGLLAAQMQMPMPQGPVSDHGKSVDGKPLASPAAEASTSLAGKTITILYNSPSMRGRAIMGGVVPYGQVWRTGANPATSFVTEGNLKIGDLMVPAGSYTLYTLPAAPGTPWMLIVNKQTGQWGTVYKPEMDLGRSPMHTDKLASPQEMMTITFEKPMKNTVELNEKWETTDQWGKIDAAK